MRRSTQRPFRHPGAEHLRSRRHAAAQLGFTLAEVLLSIVVFTIAIVGVVSVQRATLASQENAMQLRAAQRLAQHEIERFRGTGFNEHVIWDFAGVANPAFPYDDFGTIRTAPYRAAPVDINWGSVAANDPVPPGLRQDHFRILRRINSVPNGILPAGDATQLQAVQFDVWVLWIDYNPAFPPPATATVANLRPENIDPTSANFQPWVRGVHMSTVRANDGNLTPPAGGPTGATGGP